MVGRIKSETVDQVREATSIVDLIGAYVSLKRSGRNYKGLCPFHNEKSPSFSVMAERGRYHCFGCGEKGNAFDFLMAMDRVTFPEAVEILADRLGMVVEREEGPGEAPREGSSKQDLFRLNKWAAEFYRRRLQHEEGKACRAYLDKRGLDEACRDRFGLGYAPASWDALAQAARKQGIPEKLLLEAGLAKARDGKTGVYDAFRDRLIFPIRDGLERIIGFGGRSLDGSEPKYLNSPETPVFSKRRSLYGLDLLRGLKPDQPLLVTEGYTDVIMSVQAGGAFAVATLGTALTEEHAKLLSRYSSKICLVYDGDSAGRKAAERGAELFTSVDLDLDIALLAGGQDPCDFFASRGAAGLEELLAGSMDFYTFVLHEIRERHDIRDIAGRVRAADELLALARSAQNPVKREILLDKIAVDLELGRPVLEERLQSFLNPRRAAERSLETPPPVVERPPVIPEVPRTKAARRAQKQVFEAILNGAGSQVGWENELSPEDFSVGPGRALFEKLQNRAQSGLAVHADGVLSDCNDEAERRLINQLVDEAGSPELWAQQLRGAIEHLLHERRQRDLARFRSHGVTDENFVDMVDRLRNAKRKKSSESYATPPVKPPTRTPRPTEDPRPKPVAEEPPWEPPVQEDYGYPAEDDDLDFF